MRQSLLICRRNPLSILARCGSLPGLKTSYHIRASVSCNSSMTDLPILKVLALREAQSYCLSVSYLNFSQSSYNSPVADHVYSNQCCPLVYMATYIYRITRVTQVSRPNCHAESILIFSLPNHCYVVNKKSFENFVQS